MTIQTTKKPLYDDLDVWETLEPGNMWFYNKLQVSRYLGYTCGPAGLPVPEPAEYVVRPCINFLGMGRGAEVKWLQRETEGVLEAGYFWCEKFKGRHISVDYTDREPILAVEGHRVDTDDLSHWDVWTKLNLLEAPEYPRICDQIVGYRPHVNVEFIGDKVIEIHLRHNPDWVGLKDDVIALEPIYEPEMTDHPEFIHKPEHNRLGFLKIRG